MSNYDAVVVGSGPNGLAAAIVLQQKGLKVLLVEGKDTIGGGMRTLELTLPGFKHDVCSAVHPLAVAAPFFKSLPLKKYGLEYIQPEVLAAHPFEDGTSAALYTSLEKTASGLGADKNAYLYLMAHIVEDWESLSADILAPLRFPKKPMGFSRFGWKAIKPAMALAKTMCWRLEPLQAPTGAL
jgi:phytoene dehydrogenase-like protein